MAICWRLQVDMQRYSASRVNNLQGMHAHPPIA